MISRIRPRHLACFIAVTFTVAITYSAEVPSTAKPAQRNDWQPLFNGKDLSGWHVVLTPDHKGIDPDKVFQVHDGVIHAYQDVPAGVAVPIGYLASDDNYSWYGLKLEYRFNGKRFAPRTARPRDAGVLYHAGPEKKVWPRSIEYQIQEGDVGDCYIVNGAQLETTVDPSGIKSDTYQFLTADRGGVAEVRGGPKILRVIKGSTHETDGWNTVELVVRGDQEVTHIINGHEVFHAKNLKQLNSDGQSWSPLTFGHLLLQAEYAELMYRNVQIKPLEGGPFRVANEAEPTQTKSGE